MMPKHDFAARSSSTCLIAVLFIIFFRDQGSIIAGVFALIAAGIAYYIAIKQIADLKRKEQRQRASTGLSAILLLDGVPAMIADD